MQVAHQRWPLIKHGFLFKLAKQTDNSAVTYGFDTDINAGFLLADAQAVDPNYTIKRRLAAYKLDGSNNLRPINQINDDFYYLTVINTTRTNHIIGTLNTVLDGIPVGLTLGTLEARILITDFDVPVGTLDWWPAWTVENDINFDYNASSSIWKLTGNPDYIPLDSTASVNSRAATSTGNDWTVAVYGYRDNRGEP